MSYSDDTAAHFFGGLPPEQATERRKGAGGEVGLPSAVADMDRCPICETRTLRVVDVSSLDVGGTYWHIHCTSCKRTFYRDDLCHDMDEIPEAPLYEIPEAPLGGNTP